MYPDDGPFTLNLELDGRFMRFSRFSLYAYMGSRRSCWKAPITFSFLFLLGKGVMVQGYNGCIRGF